MSGFRNKMIRSAPNQNVHLFSDPLQAGEFSTDNQVRIYARLNSLVRLPDICLILAAEELGPVDYGPTDPDLLAYLSPAAGLAADFPTVSFYYGIRSGGLDSHVQLLKSALANGEFKAYWPAARLLVFLASKNAGSFGVTPTSPPANYASDYAAFTASFANLNKFACYTTLIPGGSADDATAYAAMLSGYGGSFPVATFNLQDGPLSSGTISSFFN